MDISLPQQLERWAAERVGRHLEPRVAGWVREFLAAPEGRELLAGALAEAIGDLLQPEGPGPTLAEMLLTRVLGRLVRQRPHLRERLLAALAPAAPPPEEVKW